jgi:hypothetical protein
MKTYELIGPHHVVLRTAADRDLYELARDARAVVEANPDELRNRIVITETAGNRWHWLGRAASWHPVRIAADNLPQALRRSNRYTHHAEVPMTGNRWAVALIAFALFAVIAGPAIFKLFF